MKKGKTSFEIKTWDDYTPTRLYGRENWYQVSTFAQFNFIVHSHGVSFFHYNEHARRWQMIAHVDRLLDLLSPHFFAQPVNFFTDKSSRLNERVDKQLKRML